MQDSAGNKVLRHRLADRMYHWLMAACMLVLLFTGFLPVLGVNFAWVDPHWIAGVILTVLVLFHVLRSLTWLTPSNIWIHWREFTGSVSRGQSRALTLSGDFANECEPLRC